VVDFEEAGTSAARCRAAVLVAGEDLAADAGRDGGRVAAAVLANGGVAAYSLGVGTAEFALAGVGLDRHPAGRRVFMDVDLHRR